MAWKLTRLGDAPEGEGHYEGYYDLLYLPPPNPSGAITLEDDDALDVEALIEVSYGVAEPLFR